MNYTSFYNLIKIKESAKQGEHIWYDASSNDSNETCYLNDLEILVILTTCLVWLKYLKKKSNLIFLFNKEFYQLNPQSSRCCISSNKSNANNLSTKKKKCCACKIIVHEACINRLQVNMNKSQIDIPFHSALYLTTSRWVCSTKSIKNCLKILSSSNWSSVD